MTFIFFYFFFILSTLSIHLFVLGLFLFALHDFLKIKVSIQISSFSSVYFKFSSLLYKRLFNPGFFFCISTFGIKAKLQRKNADISNIHKYVIPKGHSGADTHSAQSVVFLYISKVLNKRNSYSEWWSQGPIQFSVIKENFIMATNLVLWLLKYSLYLELAVSKYNLVNIIESLCRVKILQGSRVIILNISFHCPGSPSSPLLTWLLCAFGITFRFTHSSTLIFMSLARPSTSHSWTTAKSFGF